MSVHTPDIKRVTTHTIQEMKTRGEKFPVLRPTIIPWPAL